MVEASEWSAASVEFIVQGLKVLFYVDAFG